MLKKPNFPFLFKRLSKKGSGGNGGGAVGGGSGSGSSGSGRWKLKNLSSGLRWKRKFTLCGFVDGFLFKIVSVFEAIVLVSTLCAFFLCCGCHI